jgi:hypothetical protein
MVLFTLRAADEVRASQFGSAGGDLDAEMVAIAGAIIKQRTGTFDLSTYRDRYQEALLELIEAKIKGLTIKPREATEPPPVIDLMVALKRSLAGEEPAAKGVRSGEDKRIRAASDRRQPSFAFTGIRWPKEERRARRGADQHPQKAAQSLSAGGRSQPCIGLLAGGCNLR